VAINQIGIVGGGAWGTALAQSCCRSGKEIVIWARENETVEDINSRHENRLYLPDVVLDSKIKATADLQIIGCCDVILMVSPAQHVRAVCQQLTEFVSNQTPLVICSKGIEQSTGKLMSEVVAETLPQLQIAVLSGPTFAIEIARGLPAALSLATRDEAVGRELAHAISHSLFRTYWSNDIIGAQIGGSVKNVLAIAAGISNGKQLGTNAHAALITRGFSELVQFGMALGGRSETLSGLSGLGDLVLTCSSTKSRNMSLGYALGQGQTIDQVLGSRNSVTEGVYTASAVMAIANSKEIDMPICQAVNAVVGGQMTVDQGIESLLSRPLRSETQG